MDKVIKRVLFIMAFVLIGLCFFYFEGAVVEKVKEDVIITSVEALGIRINDELNNGNDKCTVYLKYLSEDELVNVNDELDGFFGNVTTYRVLRKYNKYMYKVELSLEVSDNYYVYRSYVYGDNINDKSDNVKELYNSVSTIISENITDSMSDYEKELVLHDYIVANCTYGFLKGDEEPYSYEAYGCLVKKEAVCNGYAEAMQLLFKCADLNSYIVVGEADNIAHAWNLIELDGRWYHVDATWNDPVPDLGNVVSHAFFNLDDESLSFNHKWNKEAYPHGEDLDYNYYTMNNGVYNSYSEFKDAVLMDINTLKPASVSVMVSDYDPNTYDFNFVFQSNTVSNVSYSVNEVGVYTIIDLVLTYY